MSSANLDFTQFPDIPNDYISKFTREYDNERELYQILATEYINFSGTPITYYTTDYNTSFDPVLGEDQTHKFTSAFEMYAKFDFPNRSRVYNQYGIISVETFNMHITMDHFDAMTGGAGFKPYTGYKPRIGDVVRNHYRDPFGYAFYEISNVNYTESQFEQAQHFWTLTLKLYSDAHLIADESLKGDPIYTNTNQNSDIFDVSQKVNDNKAVWMYNGTLEQNSNHKLLGDWSQ